MTSKLKCYVLIVSERFPKGHPKAGKVTNFLNMISQKKKIHTIRNNFTLWMNRIDEVNSGKAYISIRTWEGKPYRSKQKERLTLTKAGYEPISIFKPKTKERYDWDIGINNTYKTLDDIANNDGLSIMDFLRWFFPDPNKIDDFDGVIIHFTDFRYADKELDF
jgi:hypothetical protein